MAAWHKKALRRQVQQTVWDSSGNHSRKLTGIVRFMPYKRQAAQELDYELLACVFQLLSYEASGLPQPTPARRLHPGLTSVACLPSLRSSTGGAHARARV